MNLLYLAKPNFGGWVSFTCHLSLKYNYPLFKITKRNEKHKRQFGYGCEYQNQNIDNIKKLNNLMITAIDKNYYQYLEHLPDNTYIVIHDPTEVKKKNVELINHLRRFKVITIRESVKSHLKNEYNIESEFKSHPFYEYPKTDNIKTDFSATSRIDFDKYTHTILKANSLLDNDKQIKIYGSPNRLYIHHHINKKLGLGEVFEASYLGSFEKSFEDLDNILSKTRLLVDLSAIKKDGGGSQYTFLEAIYQNCVLVLNYEWIGNFKSDFIDKVNCLVIKDENELVELIKNIDNYDLNEIANNAYKLLDRHIQVEY